MVRLVAALAAISSFFAAVPAMAEDFDLLKNVNTETIAPIFRNAGKRVENTSIGGDPALVIREEGSITILRPRVCVPECKGLLVYAIFNGTANTARINDFNTQVPATAAFNAEGNTILKRYLIADFGITEGTLMTNYEVFRETMGIWRQQKLRSPMEAVSLSLAWPTVDYASREEVEDDAFLDALLDRRDLVNGDR